MTHLAGVKSNRVRLDDVEAGASYHALEDAPQPSCTTSARPQCQRPVDDSLPPPTLSPHSIQEAVELSVQCFDILRNTSSKAANPPKSHVKLPRSNAICTSHYTWWSFVPVFLYRTFRKPANFYFLTIGFLQMIPPISPTNGVPLQFLPLSIVVLIDGIFAAIEDYHRHRADNDMNDTRCLRYNVTSGAFETAAWKDIVVGDLLQMQDNDVVPADLVVVATNGQVAAGCYIETKSLDGETNLKLREPLLQAQFDNVAEPDIAAILNGLEFAHDQPPTPNIHVHRGAVHCRMPSTNSGRVGVDTKLMQGLKIQAMKQSTIDSVTDAQVILLVAMLVVLCVVGASLHTTWSTPALPSYLGRSAPDSPFIASFFYFLITMASILPITLNVSITAVKNLQGYYLLAVFEFTSARKRMSVVVQSCNDSQDVVVLSKGADSVLWPRLRSDAWVEATKSHLHGFATEGLRTLVIGLFCPFVCLMQVSLASKTIALDEWERFYAEYQLAQVHSGERVEQLQDDMEDNLTLLGSVTGIEDRLQDRVPETLELLSKAGIGLWVLTGDMQETAVNVGYACSLLTNDMDSTRTDPDYTSSSTDALHFLRVALLCRVVIACRCSPSQKARLVELVQVHCADARTLAIGDGANDVPMISTAHVGVGIAGEEGRQAVNSSDFAVGQFHFLARLVLVHGRWNYTRVAHLIGFTYYKNIVYCMSMFWFMLTYSAYSGSLIYARATTGRPSLESLQSIEFPPVKWILPHLHSLHDNMEPDTSVPTERMRQEGSHHGFAFGQPANILRWLLRKSKPLYATALPQPRRWDTTFLQFVLASASDVFENERYQPFLGFGHTYPGHLLPSDRGHWSNATGSVSTNQDISTALLTLDENPNGDDHGWEYAWDFSQFPQRTCHRKLGLVRRRRWVVRDVAAAPASTAV
ncbi:hypothetical protein DYB36_003505 [Aphanomyces astaci]|uniref:Uncharacterized protein n=1 Tax=Aphanomyces astaci TaxID=112090 RepID=A0A397ALA8_APHAT|nr:hypothetical protein DYB36_003505 [Aphanomyces astaci]